ncbi:MAG: glycosyltransferase family 2 protein [Sphingobacteriales bacterium]|nr:MAG: glycosyltransferase family 2 protein [Sphingobacteriales bacterium]
MEYKACVLLPVHNSEETLADVLESIFKQTYSDFKVLVVDDGSTDGTANILSNYKGEKLKVLRFKEKIGIVNALNWSLSEISEEYIIRADAQVLSVPGRFEALVNFMDKNLEVGVCGSLIAQKTVNISPQQITDSSITYNDEIAAQMLLQNPLARGSMIIRSSVLQEKGFRLSDRFKYMEDYDLWYRMLPVTKFANINLPLVYYKNGNAATKAPNYNRDYRAEAINFYLNNLIKFGIKPTDKELKLHLDLSDLVKAKKISNPAYYKLWMDKLKEQNHTKLHFPQEAFGKFLQAKWRELFAYVLKKRNKKIVQYLRVDGKNTFSIIRFIISHRFSQLFSK